MCAVGEVVVGPHKATIRSTDDGAPFKSLGLGAAEPEGPLLSLGFPTFG